MAFLEYEPSSTLYHYCTCSGLEGILKSKSLWFSDLTAMNDPREIQLGFEHFVAALKDVRHSEYRGYRGFFLSVLAGRLVATRNSTQAFCCCLSLAGDQLPLWNEYTSYAGLSIGFRKTAMNDIPARIQRAHYLDEDTPGAFRRKVLEIAAPFDPDGTNHDEAYWIGAGAEAYAAITALKHDSWAYEREVRVVHMQPIERPSADLTDALEPELQDSMWVQPLFRTRGTTQIPYLSFPFGRARDGERRHKWAIERIIIGPKCSMSEAEVRELLHSEGYENVEVARSNCQIR